MKSPPGPVKLWMLKKRAKSEPAPRACAGPARVVCAAFGQGAAGAAALNPSLLMAATRSASATLPAVYVTVAVPAV